MQELVLWVQGIYFAITGIWPLLHYRSFEKITGPKTDVWLVKTAGALILVISAPLILGALSGHAGLPVMVTGMGAAAALFLVDVVYVSKKVIRPVYLADAAVQLVLVLFWIASLYSR